KSGAFCCIPAARLVAMPLRLKNFSGVRHSATVLRHFATSPARRIMAAQTRLRNGAQAYDPVAGMQVEFIRAGQRKERGVHEWLAGVMLSPNPPTPFPKGKGETIPPFPLGKGVRGLGLGLIMKPSRTHRYRAEKLR